MIDLEVQERLASAVRGFAQGKCQDKTAQSIENGMSEQKVWEEPGVFQLDSSAEQSTDIFVLDARGWKFSVLSREYRIQVNP